MHTSGMQLARNNNTTCTRQLFYLLFIFCQVDLLNPDERSKVLQKREKNKVAAEKCRVKRREKVEQTRSEYYDCQEANESLEAQIKQLREEKLMLQKLLDAHHCVKQHA